MMSIHTTETADARTADARPDDRRSPPTDGRRAPPADGGLPPHGTDDVAGPDTLFEVLSDQHRRYVLYDLVANGQTTGDRLVELLAVTMDDAGGRATRQRLVRALREEHLPALVDAGLVRFDTDSKTIALDFVPMYVLEWIERARLLDRRR